jgi:hypothetical protein
MHQPRTIPPVIKAPADAAITRLAQGFLRLASSAASVILGCSLSIVLGLNPLPVPSPIIALAGHNVAVSIAAGALVVALVIGSLLVSRTLERGSETYRNLGVKALHFLGATLISTLGSATLCLLIGFSTLPSQIPALALLKQNPPLGIGIIGLILVLVTLVPLLVLQPDPSEREPGSKPSRLLISTAISAISTALLVAMITLVLVRPSWCPPTLCLIVVNPNAAYDTNLEAYFTATQSTAFVLSGDPTRYTSNTLPDPTKAGTISVVQLDAPQTAPYRAVVEIHSLQHDTPYNLLIEQVAIVVDKATALPAPLNVWVQGPTLIYNKQLYEVRYTGAPAGVVLPAAYLTVPGEQVQLPPGGGDELDVQVASSVPISLEFKVQITYRVANESGLHTLIVPHEFAVVFATAASMNAYQLVNGHLVPTTKE